MQAVLTGRLFLREESDSEARVREYSAARVLSQPILTECPETWKSLAILRSIGRNLACDDVVRMANGKALNFHMTMPRILESFNPIRGEYQVQIERTIFELDEVFSSFNFTRLRSIYVEPQLPKGSN